MNKYALVFVAKDRHGLVADAAKILYECGFNIADSSSTLLSGIFSMILIVTHSRAFQPEEIKAMFTPYGMKPAVHKIADDEEQAVDNAYVYDISVYGADKEGLVYKIAALLAQKNINILNLQTQISGQPPKEIYIMIFEVLLPHDIDENWQAELKKVAESIGTDISIRSIEAYEL